MKRETLLSLALICGCILTTHAQQKFYLKASGGYFFSVFPGQFPKVGSYEPHDERKEYNAQTGATTTISEKILTGSYGAGGRGGLSFGWNINHFIAVEGAFNYYRSKENLMTREITTLAGSNQVVGKIEANGYVKAVDFAPSVVFNPNFEKVNPYVRFGMVIPLWGRLNIATEASRSGTTVVGGQTLLSQTEISREESVHPNVTIGFQGALGVLYPVTKRLDIFLETEYRNVPVRSKKKEVTAYDESITLRNPATGAAVATQTRGLNDLSEAERYTEYQTTLNQQSNTPVSQEGATVKYKDDNKPSNDLKSYINIGGLGANAGLRWRL
ncbi:outer membrane beta-barrel protein [Chitinophaga tropicalis]|uniref:Outer membrane beta-barrel protein n=1 Tax=Chitinophaga tropicalis TaxID=2683588 RepID=A0A7K1UA21_9BACT|nr:outer membrane beta-barrel protein [Chitinophaga tropicalis]MVT11193.1 outer membrane beta-barrel protein [Chitinophaga tropicalis]